MTNPPVADLPLIVLQPVVDGHHAWVAMLLRANPLPDEGAQKRLFDAAGLAEALDGLPCVVPALGTAAETTDGYIRHIPAETASDPASAASEVPVKHGGGPFMALGVDSFSAFERCRKSGFSWFAGNYALQPIPGMSARNAARHTRVLQLLTLIGREAESRELEEVVKQDPQLSYQLLRLVNSVAFSPGRTITSFTHAITMLGRKPMQRWLQLLLYARPDEGGHSPLLPRAALRAALMEQLFSSGTEAMRELAFMAGMFSLLDVMMNESMTKLLAPLQLAVEVNRALLGRRGALGPALHAVETSEKNAAALGVALDDAHIPHGVWTGALIRACHWAVRVSREA
ncbi:MAG: HDOD domain-containing protein [Gammaproteobacteria bacterium]|nr:HDOD domain-containing protein [Gammaproteobacteria bacterium]MBU1415940.1 HDOD domain-containing protein [Gammaproteobacteria bacterium]